MEVRPTGDPYERFRDSQGRVYNALPVVVTNVDISLAQAFSVTLKFALASIPAFFVMAIIYAVIIAILASFGLSPLHLPGRG